MIHRDPVTEEVPLAVNLELSKREKQVLRCLVDGMTNKEISRQLKIAPDTVKTHIAHIMDKKGMSTRLELALAAKEHKDWIDETNNDNDSIPNGRTVMSTIQEDNQEYHIRYSLSKVERLQELRKEGKQNVEVSIDQLEMLLVENVSLHLHMKRLEEAVGNAFEFTSLLKTTVDTKVKT